MNEQNIEEVVSKAIQTLQSNPQSSWQGQQFLTVPEVQTVSIPIKIQTSQGSLRVYLAFGAEWGATAQKLQELIDTLESMGFPLDAWQKKEYGGNSNWGGGGSNYRSGGYNRGYRRY